MPILTPHVYPGGCQPQYPFFLFKHNSREWSRAYMFRIKAVTPLMCPDSVAPWRKWAVHKYSRKCVSKLHIGFLIRRWSGEKLSVLPLLRFPNFFEGIFRRHNCDFSITTLAIVTFYGVRNTGRYFLPQKCLGVFGSFPMSNPGANRESP